MATSIITDSFRIENAKKFIQGFKARIYPANFADAQSDYERVSSELLEGELDVMYMFIGKIISWYANDVEEPIPDTNGYLREVSEIWSNALVAKKVSSADISHVTLRENWTLGTEYPFYSSTESNTSTFSSTSVPNFFVLDENEYRVYKCLFNNYGDNSTAQPTLVSGVGGDIQRYQREPFYTNDGYLWKYMYTIDPADILSFVTDRYIPVKADSLNDDGSSTDNASKDGAIYRIWFPSKSNAASTVASESGDDYYRIRIEDLDSTTDLTASGLTIDLTNHQNAIRILSTATTSGDLTGYQIEHLISDGGNTTIEIAEIVDSTVSPPSGPRTSIDVVCNRLDDVSASGFTTISGLQTETWFMSPLIKILGEGENASAMMRINGEAGWNTSSQRLIPTAPYSNGEALDIIMNTTGSGYYNVYYQNDFDGTQNSLVEIRQGLADLSSSGTPGDQTDSQDLVYYDAAEIVSVTPKGGHSSDNIAELYGYTIMINQSFEGDESGSSSVENDFRQIALIQNPLEADGTLADANIYRQTIRLEFDGDITSTVGVDDEISNASAADVDKLVFGRVVETEYDATASGTLVYLSSSYGFLQRSAQEVYDLDPTGSHRLYLSEDVSAGTTPYTALTLTPRTIVPGSDGAYQRGLASNDDRELKFLTGQAFFLENRLPISRASDQTENIKLIIEY